MRPDHIFPYCIITAFFIAGVICVMNDDYKKGWFYFLSAAININVIFLK